METQAPDILDPMMPEEEAEPTTLSSVHVKAYLDHLHACAAETVENAPPFDSDVSQRIKEELYRIASSYGEIPSVKEQLDTVNWAVQNVMVGTVRSQKQLAYCLKENFYYIPARLVPEKRDRYLEYVALHVEEADGSAYIKYYGRISNVSMLQRHQIPFPMNRENDQEQYLTITIEEWMTLENPIPVQDTIKGPPHFTNLFLLKHCNRSYQLFSISSAEDYKICASIIKAYNHRYEAGNLHILGGRFIMRTEGEEFVLMNAYGRMVDRFPISLYEKRPSSVIFRIKDLLRF